MNNSFVKTAGPETDPDFFAAEAASLRWLSAGGARVVEVISVSADRIELQRVTTTRPTVAAAEAFGDMLARTHDAGADAFGSPPDGYDGRQFIGKLPLPTVMLDRWGEFYASARVLPFLEAGIAAGNVSARDAELTRDACDLIASGKFDDGASPARLHGDLWGGNVMWTPEGAVLIDPAAHGGHRETDLAMLALFGCPHLDSIIDGYHRRHPLTDGFRQRIPMHQLHPLAVHSVRHGPGYGVALGDAARKTLELAGGGG